MKRRRSENHGLVDSRADRRVRGLQPLLLLLLCGLAATSPACADPTRPREPAGWRGWIQALQQDPANEDCRRHLLVSLQNQPCRSPWRAFPHAAGAVWSAVFSPDGTRLVTACSDGLARVWELRLNETQTPLTLQHGDPLRMATFSADGRRILTVGGRWARVWDAATGKPLWQGRHDGQVQLAVLSPDGARLATASARTVRLWEAATGELLALPLIHEGQVWCLDFHPDGTLLVTASGERFAHVWDARSGQLVRTAPLHGAPVYFASYAMGGSRLVTASKDGAVRVSDVCTGDPVAALSLPAGFRIRMMNPEGRLLASQGVDPTQIGVWDLNSGRTSGGFALRGLLKSACLSSDGRWVLTAEGGGSAQVWNPFTGQPASPPLEPNAIIEGARFSPDGKWVATACDGRPGTACVWPLRPWRMTCPWSGRALNGVTGLAFARDGSRLLTGSDDGTARILEPATGRETVLRHTTKVRQVSFSPDERTLMTTADDGTMRLWDGRTGSPLTGRLMDPGGDVAAASYSPDGKLVLTVSAAEGGYPPYTARLWNAATGEPAAQRLENADAYRAIFSPDGTRIATAAGGAGQVWGAARVWETSSGRPVTPPLAHRGSVTCLAFSADGRRLVTGTSEGLARIWDARSGRLLIRALGPVTDYTTYDLAYGPDHSLLLQNPHLTVGDVNEVCFSPNGKYVLTAAGTARVWEAASGKPTSIVLTHPVSRGTPMVLSAAFSPDGGKIVTGGGDTARVWGASTGKPITRPLPHHSEVWLARFSPEGRRILTASFGAGGRSAARVWDAQTGKALMPLFPEDLPTEPVVSACFSPDGGRIATASEDGTARIWDATTGRPVTPPISHGPAGYRIRSVAFSPDGRKVVTAANDGTARTWNARTGDPLPPLPCHAEAIEVARFSQDGRRVLTASRDGARVWNGRSGQACGPWISPGEGVEDADLSPDGRWVAAAAGSEACVWSAFTGKEALPRLKHDFRVETVRYDPTGMRLWTADHDGFRIWDAATGKLLGRDRSGHPVRFSPDGRWALSGAVRIWNTTTGEAVGKPLAAPSSLTDAWFDATGNHVVTACAFTVQVWAADSGKAVSPLIEHEKRVTLASVSPDGRFLVTATQDGAQLWELPSGHPLTPPLGGSVGAAAFSPDGRSATTGGRNGLLQWRLDADLDEPAPLLILEAELTAGVHLEPGAGESPLDLQEYQAGWMRWEGEAQSHAVQCRFPDANLWLATAREASAYAGGWVERHAGSATVSRDLKRRRK